MAYLISRRLVVSMTINCMDPYDCWTYTVCHDPDLEDHMTPYCQLVPFKIKEETSVRRAKKGEIPARLSVRVDCIRIGNEIGEDGNGPFMYGDSSIHQAVCPTTNSEQLKRIE